MTSDPGPARQAAADEDAVLADALARRQPDALAALYDRHGATCYALARRIVTDPQLAEDVVQETFLAVWRSAVGYDGSRGPVRSWLLSVTHHKAVDLVRREQRHRARRAAIEELGDAPGAEAPVDEQAVAAVGGAHVRAALRQLPAAQRDAMLLAYFGGHTQSEIATLVGSPVGTVKTRMFAAARRLRELLDSAAEVERP